MTFVTPPGYQHTPYEVLAGAWDASKRRAACDRCGRSHPTNHHATCFGENICHDCYEKNTRVVTQCYRGDLGYGIMP